MSTEAIERGSRRNGEDGPNGESRPLPRTSLWLTVVGALLMAAAALSALQVVLSGDILGSLPAAENPSGNRGPGLAVLLATAREAEESGDVATALSRYRAAARVDPRIVDRQAPEFLGTRFEETIRTWAEGLRTGRMTAGPEAARDAAYLFRRMYGGCG